MKDVEELWTVLEVAAYLRVPVATIYQWRHRRWGPPGRRVGRYVRFDPDEVRAWFSARDDGVA
jgi:excisionase family DNA binding protein